MVESARDALESGRLDDRQMHDAKFAPFLKHQHPHFFIQKEKVEYTKHEKKKEIEQYFFQTNDNQFMLIYPNFAHAEIQNEVIQNLA